MRRALLVLLGSTLVAAACGRTSIDLGGLSSDRDAGGDATKDAVADAPSEDAPPAACEAGTHRCEGSDECVPEGVTSCGDGCTHCPDPSPFGKGACTDGACTPICNDGYAPCDEGCCPRQVGGGVDFTCYLGPDWKVRCWGQNSFGQLGDGSLLAHTTPAEVALEPKVVALSVGGSHACATTDDAEVYCWGNNGFAQILDTKTPRYPTPTNVPVAAGARIVAAGDQGTCAVTTSDVLCWGMWGPTILRAPFSVGDLSPDDVASLSTGTTFACAQTTTGGAKCWGWGGFLGNGSSTIEDTKSAVDVTGLESNVVRMAAGSQHTCAAMADGEVSCWGYNIFGQCGSPNTVWWAKSPISASGVMAPIVALSSGGYFTCGKTSAGAIQCWGDASAQQYPIPTGTNGSTAIDVPDLAGKVLSFDSGQYHSCAVLEDGGVVCWGGNWGGQLGDGTTNSSSTPVAVRGL